MSFAAMLAYKTVSGTKNYKKAMHLLIQLLAFCLSIIGFWAALKFHNDKGIDNFYSLHSWLGLACLVLFGIQVCFQILLFILYNFFFFYFFSFSIFFFFLERKGFLILLIKDTCIVSIATSFYIWAMFSSLFHG